jgi:hypothetical protein
MKGLGTIALASLLLLIVAILDQIKDLEIAFYFDAATRLGFCIGIVAIIVWLLRRS